MNVLKDSELFTADGIAKIEKMKNAKYVCDTCLRAAGGGWVNDSVAIFYQDDPSLIPPGGSAYFGLFHRYMGPGEDTQLMITNAISATEEPITGVVAKNGDIIYSRFRHDYRLSPDGTAMVDGGRDYFRTGPVGIGTVTLEIIDGELKITKLHNMDRG